MTSPVTEVTERKPEAPEVRLGAWGALAAFFNPVMVLVLILTPPPGWVLLLLHALACAKVQARARELAKRAEELSDAGHMDEACLYLEAIERHIQPDLRPERMLDLWLRVRGTLRKPPEAVGQASGSADAATRSLLDRYAGYPTRFGQFLYGSYEGCETFSDGRFIEMADPLPEGLRALGTGGSGAPLTREVVKRSIPVDLRAARVVRTVTTTPDGKVALSDGVITVLVDRVYWDYIAGRYPAAAAVILGEQSPVLFTVERRLRAVLMPMTE
jgi:hypothetical protein